MRRDPGRAGCSGCSVFIRVEGRASGIVRSWRVIATLLGDERIPQTSFSCVENKKRDEPDWARP
jgi:hypothetical protein